MRTQKVQVPKTLKLAMNAVALHQMAKLAIMDFKSMYRKENTFPVINHGTVPVGLRKFRSAMVLVDIDNRFIKRTARKALKKTEEREGIGTILDEVAGSVGRKIRYNIKIHEKSAQPWFVSAPIGYFRLHGGVCRHQSACVAGVLQLLREDGRISGEIKIVHGFQYGMLKGHAWIEVVSDGNRFVVDPTGGIATDNKAFIEEEYDKKYPVR